MNNRFKRNIVSSIICILLFVGITPSFAANIVNTNIKAEQLDTVVSDEIIITKYGELPSSFREYLKEDDSSIFSGATGWKDYKLLSSGWHRRDYDAGWHPSFPREKKVDFYYFSNSRSVSMGLSIGGEYISFGVSAEATPSTGYGIKADSSIWTRPKVYTDIKYYRYNVKEYNGAGILIDEYEITVYTVDRSYIKAVPYNN